MLNSTRLRRALALVALILALGACTNEDIIRMAFADRGASPQQQEEAIAVAQCESGMNPNAISPGGGNWGLFQINRVHSGRAAAHGWAWEHMLYSWENSLMAAELWSEQGWRPWTCARHLGIS